MITGLTTKPDTVTFSPVGESYRINGRIEFPYITPVGSETITLSKKEGTVSEPTSWYSVWSNVLIKVQTVDNTTWENVTKYSSNPNQNKVTLDKLGNGAIGGIQITESALKHFENSKNNLSKFKLEKIDLIRDTILQTKGNVALNINSTIENTGFDITRAIITSRKSNLGGLLLKTYDSDVFQNWIKTDWIDGENGISAISAVAVQDGIITIDSLNLQQKVYSMLNRIAVSGGTYRDWLETVYTTGNYMERPETPVFEGGMSQLIQFEEVVSKSATEDQPLGDLAGRGVSSKPNSSGKLHFKVTEPSYIIGIAAITPLIDYSQGNDWDMVNIKTMDDFHKPALDGIGYEDSMNNQRGWWTRDFENNNDTSAGKTVAWINYMTNFNKTFGNFASGESESFMCLNRNYEQTRENTISDLTTYIDPAKHNEIFADTDLGSQNFWVQTAFDIKVSRNISAKQIPNI